MEKNNRKAVTEREDKVRCANYLLQMLEKYGATVIAKCKKETGKSA